MKKKRRVCKTGIGEPENRGIGEAKYFSVSPCLRFSVSFSDRFSDSPVLVFPVEGGWLVTNC